MEGISLRRGIQGVLTLLTGACGMWSFAMMNTDEPDKVMLFVVSWVGIGAAAASFANELYIVSKATQRNSTENREERAGVRVGAEVVDEYFLVVRCLILYLLFRVLDYLCAINMHWGCRKNL